MSDLFGNHIVGFPHEAAQMFDVLKITGVPICLPVCAVGSTPLLLAVYLFKILS